MAHIVLLTIELKSVTFNTIAIHNLNNRLPLKQTPTYFFEALSWQTINSFYVHCIIVILKKNIEVAC